MDAFGGVMLALTFFIFGAMLGVGIFGLVQNKKNTNTKIVYRYRDLPKPEDSDERPTIEDESDEEELKEFIPKSSPPPKTPNTSKKDWTSKTTQVWYDTETRSIVAEIDGEILDKNDEMNQEQKARFSFLVLDLKKWIGENLLPGMEDDEDQIPVVPIQEGHDEIEQLEGENLSSEEVGTSDDLGADEPRDLITEIEDKIISGFSKAWNYFMGDDEDDEQPNQEEDIAGKLEQKQEQRQEEKKEQKPERKQEKKKGQKKEKKKVVKQEPVINSIKKLIDENIMPKMVKDTDSEKQLSPFDPRSIMKGIVAAETDKIKSVAPPSIADQINEILRKELVGSKWPLGHLEIFDDDDHTINFRVGVDVFQGVDEIKDKKARKVIQNAIDTWQASLG